MTPREELRGVPTVPDVDDSPVAPSPQRRPEPTLFRAEAVDAYRNPRSTFGPPEVRLTFPALWLWSGLLIVVAASAWLVALPVRSAHEYHVTKFARCAKETVAFQFAPKPNLRKNSVSMVIADRPYPESEFMLAAKPLRCVQADGTAVEIGDEPTQVAVLLKSASEPETEPAMPAIVTVVFEESLWSVISGTSVGSGAVSQRWIENASVPSLETANTAGCRSSAPVGDAVEVDALRASRGQCRLHR